MSNSAVLLAAREPSLVEAVEASALALDVGLDVVTDPDELAARWHTARLRLVAADMVRRVLSLGAPPGTHLVGRTADDLAAASAETGCPVLLLPGASGRLPDPLPGTSADAGPAAHVVAVRAASGGLGASTLCVALGQEAVRRGMRAVCVELAPHGGGLDLLVGRETDEGVRWADVARARGELGGIEDALVRAQGLGVLALDRERALVPDAEAVHAVLGALRRSVDVVFLDLGRQPHPDADQQVLLVGADVRSVAAARMAAKHHVGPGGLVVRRGRGRQLAARVVADSLGAPLLGALREDTSVPRLAELGQPPLSAPARKLRKDVSIILDGLRHG